MSDPLTILRQALKRRRRGKIAQLPEPVRDQINLLLDDGRTYAEIIAQLGDAGRGLNKDNLSRWRKADHPDWLEERLWLEAVRESPQLASPTPANRMARVLLEFNPVRLKQTLSRNPGKLPALLHAIGRLSEASRPVPMQPDPSESDARAVTPTNAN